MDPLMIAGARCKRIDARLVDCHPIGNPKLLSDTLVQARKRKSTHAEPSLLSFDLAELHVAI
jgi:hypothetical protein